MILDISINIYALFIENGGLDTYEVYFIVNQISNIYSFNCERSSVMYKIDNFMYMCEVYDCTNPEKKSL